MRLIAIDHLTALLIRQTVISKKR